MSPAPINRPIKIWLNFKDSKRQIKFFENALLIILHILPKILLVTFQPGFYERPLFE
jgi:hypothetical protein